MDHGLTMIPTLAICLGAALVFGWIALRLRLSPIAGYLIAGVVIGPHTPGLVAHAETATELSELGVLLLMFGVGLQLHVRDLLAVRRVAPAGALACMVLVGAGGFAAGQALGWPPVTSFVVGAAISVASTVVVVRTLTERRDLHTRTGHVALGWLVAEDLASVILLVLLPLAGGEKSALLWRDLGIAIGGVALMVALAATAGRAIIPKLLTRIAHTRSAELFTLGVLVTALGIAVLSAQLFGVSLALGAFVAGLIVGQSELGSRAASDALPLRDAFAVIFFVAVGMSFDPRTFLADPGPTIALTAIVLFGKPLLAACALRVLGEPLPRAAAIATPLGQIGELSFVIASAATAGGFLDPAARHALIAASIFSILLNPLVAALARTMLRDRDATDPPPRPADRHRAVIVGCGPIGQVLIELLQDNGVEPTIVDLNPETVASLRARGVHAICGDATRPEILESAGIAEAAMLVSAASGTPAGSIAKNARAIRPSIRIVARASYLEEGAAARVAGAHRIVSAEAEVALAMTEAVLDELGAGEELLRQARRKVRQTLAERYKDH